VVIRKVKREYSIDEIKKKSLVILERINHFWCDGLGAHGVIDENLEKSENERV
jgi:hypothetical protein